MLRAQAHLWTADKLATMIDSRQLPDDYVQGAADYIKDKPHLWLVSDDEFLAAVKDVDPRCAGLLGTPQGLDFLHRMSRAIALRRGANVVGGLFGLGG